MDYQPGLKAILDNSGTLVSWALAVVGGSVAALIGSSYERPKTWRGRLIYLLFPLISRIVYLCGRANFSRFIAAQVKPDPENVRNILMLMNDDFHFQLLMLQMGLAFCLCGYYVFWPG